MTKAIKVVAWTPREWFIREGGTEKCVDSKGTPTHTKLHISSGLFIYIYRIRWSLFYFF